MFHVDIKRYLGFIIIPRKISRNDSAFLALNPA